MAVRREDEETGWVIERHQNSQLVYWNGRPRQYGTDGYDQDAAWTGKHEDAIRFAREEDAAVVLAWMLKGNGRVAQHAWIPAAKSDSGTPS